MKERREGLSFHTRKRDRDRDRDRDRERMTREERSTNEQPCMSALAAKFDMSTILRTTHSWMGRERTGRRPG